MLDLGYVERVFPMLADKMQLDVVGHPVKQQLLQHLKRVRLAVQSLHLSADCEVSQPDAFYLNHSISTT